MKKNNQKPKKEHWEVSYRMHIPSKNMIETQGADFVPKRPQDRKTTYLKVNKEDH